MRVYPDQVVFRRRLLTAHTFARSIWPTPQQPRLLLGNGSITRNGMPRDARCQCHGEFSYVVSRPDDIDLK